MTKLFRGGIFGGQGALYLYEQFDSEAMQ